MVAKTALYTTLAGLFLLGLPAVIVSAIAVTPALDPFRGDDDIIGFAAIPVLVVAAIFGGMVFVIGLGMLVPGLTMITVSPTGKESFTFAGGIALIIGVLFGVIYVFFFHRAYKAVRTLPSHPEPTS